MRQLEFLQLTTGFLKPFVVGQIRRRSERANSLIQGEVANLTVDHETLHIRFAWLGKAESLYGRWVKQGKDMPRQVNLWTNVRDLDQAVRLVDYEVAGPYPANVCFGDGTWAGFHPGYDGGCIHLISHLTDERIRLWPRDWSDPHEEWNLIHPCMIRGLVRREAA